MQHQFSEQIKTIIQTHFEMVSQDIYDKSPLLQYLNIKTRSATRGSKARGSFANIYAIYVLVEDYVFHGFNEQDGYSNYEGAKFTNLLQRQRELPFGSKLQNHALNHRMNEEFRKYFPQVEYIPILRNVETNRYWFNENLLKIPVVGKTYNIARAILEIVELYVKTKQATFESFIQTCEQIREINAQNQTTIREFILGLLAPNVDARIFEIVSYAILKYYYYDQKVYFGFELEKIQRENLKLYKTGRTNANDGGIDFVMRPLGRFFQVTETLDVRKYFLDIDKIERYPISFVIKSEELPNILQQKLQHGAENQYVIKAIVQKYMDSIEEIINIPILKDRFDKAIKQGYLPQILDEIIKQSKVEFNYQSL